MQYRCKLFNRRECKELLIILDAVHFKTLLECHDNIALMMENMTYRGRQYPELFRDTITTGTIRMVGVRKQSGEPLGLTVRISLENQYHNFQ